MKFFDAHCDTAKRVLDGEVDFSSAQGGGHVSLPGMLEAGIKGQIFACFVLSERHPGEERARAEAMIATVRDMVAASQGEMAVVLTAGDLERAFSGGPIGALIGLEGADPLGDDAENLRHFFKLGVRDVIPAWKDNAFSGTAFGKNTLLTEEGVRLIELAEELGVMVDVSHLSDAAFAKVCEVAKKPFIASHSNCRALCPSPRNLTDAMIRKIADRGGVVGINLSSAFLDPEFYDKTQSLRKTFMSSEEKEAFREKVRELPRPEADWIVRHIKHAINVGGEDCIGLGGDLDGISSMPRGFETIADYAKIPDLLLQAGLKPRQVEKLCFRNFLRVFREVLPR